MFRKNQSILQEIVSIALTLALTVSLPGLVLLQTPDRDSVVRPTDSAKTQKVEDETPSDPNLISKENTIILNHGRGKNSFTTDKSKGTESLVKIDGAENNGKLLNGAFNVVFQCFDSPEIIWQSLLFTAGRSETKIACRIKVVLIVLAYIILNKDAITNGFGVKEIGGGQTLINITGAKNPITGELLNGKFNFVYKCKQIIGLIAFTVVLAKGYAEQRASCAIDRDPRIYY